MRIHYDGLALPVSTKFAHALQTLLNEKQIDSESVTINFRDPT